MKPTKKTSDAKNRQEYLPYKELELVRYHSSLRASTPSPKLRIYDLSRHLAASNVNENEPARRPARRRQKTHL